MENRVLELERKFADLASSQDRDRESNAVIGGLGGLLTMELAIHFAIEQAGITHAPEPLEIFAKDEFNNILFAKFASANFRDTLVNTIGRAQIKHWANVVWPRPDHPIETRVPGGV